jgi:hypothetical protein
VPGGGAAALAARVTAATIIVALVTGHGGGPLGTAPGPPTGLAHVLAAAASVGHSAKHASSSPASVPSSSRARVYPMRRERSPSRIDRAADAM